MVTHREYKYINTTITDRVYQAVLISNSSAPLTVFSLQRFWLANTRKRVLLYIFKQGCDTFKNTCIARALPIISVGFGLFQ